MRYVAALLAVLMLTSCAPRFTVYIDVSKDIPRENVVILDVDTVGVGYLEQKRVRYVLKRDVYGLERLFLRRKMK